MSSFGMWEIYFTFVKLILVNDCKRQKGRQVMYSYLKERVKHAVRFRHKRGFGVHSPFMFNFILNVVRDRRHRFVYPEQGEKQCNIGNRDRKFYRLLYRLAVYLKPSSVWCVGVNPETLKNYLEELPDPVSVRWNETEGIEKAGFIYIGRDSRIGDRINEDEWVEVTGKVKQCIVICDIHKNGLNVRLWQRLGSKATVRIDMMWYGILLFDSKLQKGSYNLVI